MGAELNTTPLDEHSQRQAPVSATALLSRLPWLDEGTASLLSALVSELALRQPEVVAIILFGSLARHEERPLHSPRPSDVDLLVLVESAPPEPSSRISRLPLEQLLAIHHIIGERQYHHQVPALGVQATIAEWDLADWDSMFVANVARDGILLWARCPLPPALAPVAARGAISTSAGS